MTSRRKGNESLTSRSMVLGARIMGNHRIGRFFREEGGVEILEHVSYSW